jgi:tetratricopeptide (TPR) repeat protein
VETSTSKIEIPELLARSGKVGSEMEANKMFNTYKALKDDIESNPKDYASRLKMADLYIVEARATGNYGYYYPAAVKMIDVVLAENPEKSEDKFRALTSKAVIQLSYHKFEEARETGREALKLNPHNSRVYGILTDANVEMGDYQQAVVMADSMVAIRPDLRSYSRVSYLREIFGEVKGAQQAMKMAIKAGAPGHEETTWSHVTLGNLYENYGQLDSAKMQYEIALAEREGYPFALKGLASIEGKKGNNEEAIKLLKQAIDTTNELEGLDFPTKYKYEVNLIFFGLIRAVRCINKIGKSFPLTLEILNPPFIHGRSIAITISFFSKKKFSNPAMFSLFQ